MLICLSLLAFVGCKDKDKNDEPAVDNSMSVSPAAKDVALAGGSFTVTIKSSSAWSATTDKDWVVLDPSQGQGDAFVKIIVEAGDADEANVLFSNGKSTATLKIARKAIDEPTEDPSVEPSEDPSVDISTQGVLSGRFAIAEGRYVRFSQGNLQYKASPEEWRFAVNQWDFVGDATKGNVYEGGEKCDNNKVSETYTGWIDLFCWGTSGWNSGATAYQPWSRNTESSDYYSGDLTGDYAKADWGVYNKISNGGNTVGLWRTLKNEEWQYLFAHQSSGWGTIFYGEANDNENAIRGIVLVPEGWKTPEGVSFSTAGNTNYTATQWKEKMEPAGAVFLPWAGNRGSASVVNVGTFGAYWSVSSDGSGAKVLSAGEGSYTNPSDWYGRTRGLSVRLVRDESLVIVVVN